MWEFLPWKSARFDSWFGHQGAGGWKHEICDSSLITSLIFVRFLWWVLLARIHDISYGFLIWPTFEGHRGQCLFCHGRHLEFVFRPLTQERLYWSSPFSLCMLGLWTYRSLSILVAIRHPVWPTRRPSWIHEICDSSLITSLIFVRFLWWVLLARIHDISYGFLIWPTFEGHRGQCLFCHGRHLEFVFRPLTQERLYWSSPFSLCMLGLWTYRSLSILVAIRHPVWPTRRPSWISIPPVNSTTPLPIITIFAVCVQPMDLQKSIDFRCDPTSNMADTAAILNFYSAR